MKEKLLENSNNYIKVINKEEKEKEKPKPKIHLIYKYSIIILLILESIFLILSI